MRWLRAGFLPVSTMIIVAAAFIVPLPLFVERPGRTVPLGPCVEVADPAATPVEGEFLLLTVSVLHATVVDALVAAFEETAIVSPPRNVIPPDTTVDAFYRQQLDEFRATTDVAAVVGLAAAGLPASIDGDGARLIHVAPGSPAADALERGDVVTEAGGTTIDTADELRAAVRASTPGEPLELSIRRGGQTLTVDVRPVEYQGAPRLGVVPETVRQRVNLPTEVEVLSGTVGGPSGGLMIALTVYDEVLPDVDLAAGRLVAGSGTLDESGRVGGVGGIDLKVIAAERLGADVFIAPAANLATAQAAVAPGSDMEVIGVESFDQARRALLDRDPSDTAADRPPSDTCPYSPDSGERAAGTLAVPSAVSIGRVACEVPCDVAP